MKDDRKIFGQTGAQKICLQRALSYEVTRGHTSGKLGHKVVERRKSGLTPGRAVKTSLQMTVAHQPGEQLAHTGAGWTEASEEGEKVVLNRLDNG